ncbi:MAG: hypothetical protein V4530_09990 [Pseudomonadota bacterium]
MNGGIVPAVLMTLVGVAGAYMSWRGIVRNEFRLVGQRGWHRLPPAGFRWWFASTFNALFTLGPWITAIMMVNRGDIG